MSTKCEDARVKRPLLVAAALLLLFTDGLLAADHRESPALFLSGTVGSQDINDIYIFQSPTNAGNTVMIMTVNPFAGVLSPTDLESTQFPGFGFSYEFAIDTILKRSYTIHPRTLRR